MSCFSRHRLVAACASVAALSVTATAPDARAVCTPTAPNELSPTGRRDGRNQFARIDQLGVALPRQGVLVARRPRPGSAPGGIVVAPDGSISSKFPWRGGKNAGYRLKIKGTRLDGPAAPFRAFIIQPKSARLRRHLPLWATSLTFSTPGCSRINARAGTRAKLIVVMVVVVEPEL
jgi:hypothetical protein